MAAQHVGHEIVGEQRQAIEVVETTPALAVEDPRYADLQRNVLQKLERAIAHVDIRLAAGRQAQAAAETDALLLLFG